MIPLGNAQFYAAQDLATMMFTRNLQRPGATEAGVRNYVQSIFDVVLTPKPKKVKKEKKPRTKKVTNGS